MAYVAYKDNLFWGVGSYEERLLWKNAGFTYSRERKAWTTDSLKLAMGVQGVPWTKSAAAYAEQYLETAAISQEMSWKADTDFMPPAPAGLEYLPFQRAGIEYALRRKDTLIGDQPGLGKTIQAIGFHNSIPNLRKTLVVCPASLKENWRREWIKWSVKKGLTFGIAEASYIEKVPDGVYKSGARAGQTKYRNVVHRDVWPDTDVVMINYDILERFSSKIKDEMWDLLVCDECHALKTETTRRTLFVLGGVEQQKGSKGIWWNPIEARHRLFLSGTPMLNRPIELWPFVRAMDREDLGKNKREFEYAYCGGHSIGIGGNKTRFDNRGATNLVELGEKLRAKFMVRRLKRIVLPELPPVRRVVVTLTSPEITELVAREDEIAEILKLYERQVAVEAMERGDIEATDASLEAFTGAQVVANAALMGIDKAFAGESGEVNTRELNMDYISAVTGLEPSAVAEMFEELARVRHDLGVAKLSAAIPWIRDFLDGGEKLLVFGYHSDVVEGVRDALADYKPAVVYGKTALRKRQPEVDRFQEDEDCRLFDGQITAAGVGFTLTRAKDAAFVEGDWVPGNMTQCEDRMCRIGQKAEGLMSYHLVANGSLDARIAQSAQLKQEHIELALGA